MKGTRWSLGAALSIAVLLVLAACGGAEPTATALPPATPTATRAAAPTATAPAAATPTATPRPTATAAPQPTRTVGPRGTLNVVIRTLEKEVWVRRLQQAVGEPTAFVLLVTDPVIGFTPDRRFEGRWVSEWSYQTIGADNALTLRVRPGVVINEGWGTITAEDIRFNFTEVMRQDLLDTSANRILGLIDQDINNLEIVSPMEVKLHSARFDPVAPLLLFAGTGTLAPWQAKVYRDEERDDRYNEHPIGTGPFIFKSRVKFSRYTVEAVPDHWRKTSSIQTVNLLLVPEAATRLAFLNSGQADMAILQKASLPELTGNVKPRLVDNQSNVFVTLGGLYYDQPDKNGVNDPWNGYTDKARKVREALNTAIDKQTMLNKLLLGMGTLSASPLGWFPGQPWVDPSWKPLPYDPARARRLLAEAGYPDGFKIRMALFSIAQVPEQADIGEAVAGYWESIGIRVERRPMDWRPGWFEYFRAGDTAGWAYVLNQGLPADIYQVSSGLAKGAVGGYFHDPKATEYYEKAGKEADFAKRAALAREFGAYMIEQRLMIPLFSTSGLWGVGPRVAEWDNIQGFMYLNNVERVTLRP